jgi:hypothetical protein
MHTILLVVFNLLQALDGYTTERVITAGGVERNPLMAAAIRRFGMRPAIVGVKLALVLLVNFTPLPTIVLFLLVALYIAVVANNVAAMRAQH